MYEDDAMNVLYEQMKEFLEQHTVEHVILVLSDVIKERERKCI